MRARMLATSFSLGIVWLSACGGAATGSPSSERAAGGEEVAGARPEDAGLTDAELAELRARVDQLAPGMSSAEVQAILGSSLDHALGGAGTGPQSQSTEIRALGRHNILWLTWNASDLADIWLIRAVLWNEATDPMPPDLPWPPDPRPARP